MFALFPIALFVIGAILLVALPVGISLQSYFRHRGQRTVVCPENQEPVTVELDNKYSFRTALRGQQHQRLQSCSRWPEMANAGRSALPRSIRLRKTWRDCCRSGIRERRVVFVIARCLPQTGGAVGWLC